MSAPTIPVSPVRPPTAAWVGPIAAHPQVAEARRLLAADGLVALHGLAGPARLLVPLLVSGPPLLVVVSAERLVERATEDLRTLAQEAGAPGAVLALPAPGPAPFRGLPRHPEASLRRAAAVHAALRGRLSALVASPAGLLRPILAPRLFETRVIAIEVGEELTPEILLEALDEGGYRREDPVSAAGQVARRGGILDVFPPDRDTPVRIEFLGDTVESLRTFDPDTQRTTGTLDRLEVLPLTDAFAPRSVLEALRRTLPERFAGVRELPALLERLDRGLAAEEVPELLPLVPGATVPPWDVLSAWAVAVLDPEEVAAEAEAFHDRAHEERARREDPLALAVEEALVPAAALAERIHRAPAIHVREVDLDARGLHIPSRPPRRYAGDLRALAADLKAADGPTVLLLGTPGRAERLKDVLREDGLAVGEGTSTEVRLGALGTGFEFPDVPLRAAGRRRRVPGGSAPPSPARPRRAQLPLRLPRPQGRRPRGPPGPRHRPLRGPGDDGGGWDVGAGGPPPRVHGPRLPGRGQAQGAGRELRPRPEVRQRGGGPAPRRQARQRIVGEDQAPRQEGDARHGGGAAQALRRAQDPGRVMPSPGRAPGSASSRRASNSRRPTIRPRPSPTS